MRVANTLAYLQLLLAAASITSAAPAPSGLEMVERWSIEARRGGGGGKADAAGALFEVVKALVDEFKEMSKDKGKESDYVQSTLDELSAKYPNKNVLLFHDQKSVAKLNGGEHTHYEIPIAFGKTKGYEIWVFDTGSFDLHGDGGYLNWGYKGCAKRNKNHVDFCKRK